MTEPTVSAQLRLAQDRLHIINNDLQTTFALAQAIGLAPFRLAGIQAAITDNKHAWAELNEIATSLELTGQGAKL